MSRSLDKKFENLIKTVRQEPYLNFMPLGVRNPDGFEEKVIAMDKSFQEKNPNKNVDSGLVTNAKMFLFWVGGHPFKERILLSRRCSSLPPSYNATYSMLE